MHPKASLQTRKKIYQSLCYVLSDRADYVAWDEYTPGDWELFSQMADREGVAPLMYWKLKDSPVEVPPSTFNFLRSTYYQTLAQNTLMYQELDRILRALDEAGIPVIVLKGAALAATVYEDIGLRPMGDLDLLVKEEDFGSAAKLMLGLGYHENRNYVRSYRIHQLLAYHMRFINDNKKIYTELHWELIAGIADRRSPPVNWFWNHSEIFSCSSIGNRAFTLTSLAHLLHLVAHLMIKHNPECKRLLWLYDIHDLLVLKSAIIDWNELVISAERFQWLNGVFSALQEVNTLFGSPIDDVVNKYFACELSNSSLTKISGAHSDTRILKYAKKLSILNWKTRLLYIFAIVFPSPTHIRKHYDPKPKWSWPLYYPYRWFEIILDGFFTMIELRRE